MRKLLFAFAGIISVLTGSRIYAQDCHPTLRKYPQDCSIQKKYSDLTYGFSVYGIDIREINYYRSLRFIAQKDFKPTVQDEGRSFYLPWKIYNPAPRTWLYWEKGNFFREKLNEKLNQSVNQSGKWDLTLEDLKALHRQVIDKKLVGSVQNYLFYIPGYHLFFPAPGELRGRLSFDSGFRSDFDQKEKNLIKNYDLKDGDGKPFVKGKFIKTFEKDSYYGHVSYLHSKKVKKELLRLIDEMNRTMNLYFSGASLEESPIEFASRIQKKYIAIHPFHEGNGRMSRLLQDLILSQFEIPFVPAGIGELQFDIAIETKAYQSETMAQINHLLSKLEECLSEYQVFYNDQSRGFVPDECNLVYGRQGRSQNRPFPEIDTPMIAIEKKNAVIELNNVLSKFFENTSYLVSASKFEGKD